MNRNLNLLFFLRETQLKSDSQVTIYLRITINGERVELSTKRKIDRLDWDAAKQRAKGRLEKARTLNEYLDKTENQVRESFNLLNTEETIVKVTDLRDMLNGQFKKRQTLISLFLMNNKLIEQEVGSKYAISTVKQYTVTLNRFSQFLKSEYGVDDIDLKKLDIILIRRFETYLSVTFSLHHNTVMKHLKQLKKVIHFGLELGYLQKDPFLQHKTAYKDANRGFLTSEELRRIEQHVLRLPRLDRVRDVFLFVCYTGMSYSDLKLLTRTSISRGIDGKNWIIFDRKKTGVQSRIPLLPKAQAIINKYINDPECSTENRLIPVKSNQKLNTYLEEIAELCEINKHVTMHLGRHTFATTVTLTNGVPIETVSKMLGHTSLKTTQIYSKVVDTKISKDMEDLERVLSIKEYKDIDGSESNKIIGAG